MKPFANVADVIGQLKHMENSRKYRKLPLNDGVEGASAYPAETARLGGGRSITGPHKLRVSYVPDFKLAAERRRLWDFQCYANKNPHGPWFRVKHRGFLYFAVAADHPERWIKIGYSKDPAKRMNNVRLELRESSGVTSKVRLLAAIPGNLHTEAYAHRAFEEFRVHGEWYSQADPINSLIAEIQHRRKDNNWSSIAKETR